MRNTSLSADEKGYTSSAGPHCDKKEVKYRCSGTRD